MDFGLPTRAIVAPLFERQFGVDLGVTAVGSLLAIRPLTPQKPLQRACQRNPEAIALWQEQTYPAHKTRIVGDYIDSGRIDQQLADVRNDPIPVRLFFDAPSVAYGRDC